MIQQSEPCDGSGVLEQPSASRAWTGLVWPEYSDCRWHHDSEVENIPALGAFIAHLVQILNLCNATLFQVFLDESKT